MKDFALANVELLDKITGGAWKYRWGLKKLYFYVIRRPSGILNNTLSRN